jgi:hypothetical protein
VRHDRQHRAGRDRYEHRQDHRSRPVQIAEPAQHRRQDGGGEKVRRQHPAGRAGGDVQLRLDGAEDRDDEALQQ